MPAPRPLETVALLVLALVIAGCGAAEPSVPTAGDGGAHPALVLLDSLDPARPTIRRLDPALLAAVESAAQDASDEGIRLRVTSGWRSRAHQERLLTEAIEKYGSGAEALRFVATPDTSAHVTGDAVDIGPVPAAEWLGAHGSSYGLCQVFANERWHFELATTPGGQCPDMLPDSSYRG